MIVLKVDGVVPLEEPQLQALARVGARVADRPCATEEELLEHGRDADALLFIDQPITARVIAGLERCRAIGRFGAGLDTIDLEAASAAGIQVTNVPAASVEEVSDHALAMVLSLARRLPALDAAVRAGRWDSLAGGPGVRRLRGQVLGVVGLGRIGAALTRKAAALGLVVLAYDPHLTPEGIVARGGQPAELPDLLRGSDFVSVHVPLTAETRHLIGRQELALMRPGAFVVNVSRGGVVDQAALVAALDEGRLAGAALDVLEDEPPAPGDPLLARSDVLLTPHAAHYSIDSLDELRQTAVEDVARVLAGEAPRHPVNRPRQAVGP